MRATLLLPLLAGCVDLATAFEPKLVADGFRCWAGFAPADGGSGCEPVLPAQDCPPGTMALLGERTCQAVGVAACDADAGFAVDPSGWGCIEIAATTCTGATRPKLGAPGCVPVGSCTGPWPPPFATHFVNPSGPIDATHSTTILSAILAQRSAGGVIAVDPGTYVEALQPLLPMTLVGRCAEQVVVQSPGANNSGLRLRSVPVTLEGMTLRGHYTGAAVDTGGQLTLRAVVLENNRELGVTVAGAGSTLTIEGSVIRGSTSTNAAFGRGVQVQAGAQAAVRDSAVTGNQSFGVFVTDPGSSAEVTDTLITDTRSDAAGAYGLGATSAEGTLTLRRCAVLRNRQTGVSFVGGTGSVSDSVVRETGPAPGMPIGIGLLAQEGADVTVEGSTFSSNLGAGVAADGAGARLTVRDSVVRDTRFGGLDTTAAGVRFSASLSLEGCALVGNHNLAFAALEQSTATVTRTLMRDAIAETTKPHALEVGGSCITMTDVALLHSPAAAALLEPDPSCVARLERVWIHGVSPVSPSKRATGVAIQRGTVELVGSAFSDVEAVAVFVYGAGTVARLSQCSVSDSRTNDDIAGNLLVALSGTRVEIDRTDFRRAEGVALLFDGATASVFDSFVTHNLIGIGAQNGSVLDAVSERPVELTPLHVVVGTSTVFEDNQTRVGSGNYPVPAPF